MERPSPAAGSRLISTRRLSKAVRLWREELEEVGMPVVVVIGKRVAAVGGWLLSWVVEMEEEEAGWWELLLAVPGPETTG